MMTIEERSTIDAACADLLTAGAALDRLTTLVIEGSLRTENDSDLDAFATFSKGIDATISAVADSLSSIMCPREITDEKENEHGDD